MFHWKHILLLGILLIAITPAGFLLMPFMVIVIVIVAIAIELRTLRN